MPLVASRVIAVDRMLFTAAWPISASGRCTVVSGGEHVGGVRMSPKPVTPFLTSARCRYGASTVIAPMATSRLSAMIESMPLPSYSAPSPGFNSPVLAILHDGA